MLMVITTFSKAKTTDTTKNNNSRIVGKDTTKNNTSTLGTQDDKVTK